MSTLSQRPTPLTVAGGQPPSFDVQRAEVLGAAPTELADTGRRWEVVADLLDDLVSTYEDLLEEEGSSAAGGAAGAQLQAIMDAFDVVGAVARHNSEVIDDLASDLTLAQARMSTICAEYDAERRDTRGAAPGLLDRRYEARAAREMWYPLDGEMQVAAGQLRAVALAPPASADESESTVVPLNRR